MARAIVEGPRRNAPNEASFLDDIDAGWEEPPPRGPTSMIVPKAAAIPNFRRRPRGATKRIVAIGAFASAVAAAGGYFTTHRPAPVLEPVPARVPRPAARPSVAPLPPAVAVVPPPAEPAVTAVTVLINVVPKRAVIFRGSERLGSGLVAVNVERDTRQRLTAVAAGYEKARFTVDGASDTVTIYLNRVPEVAAPPAEAAAAPASEPPAEHAVVELAPVTPDAAATR